MDEHTLGNVIWHTSEEGGGPDVGISIGLGNGKSLWIGEITSERYADGGDDAKALGDDSGWWMMIYPDCLPLAKFTNGEGARELSDQIEALARRGAFPETRDDR